MTEEGTTPPAGSAAMTADDINSIQWEKAIQVEQYKSAQVTSAMQAIAAVPVFDGATVDLEYFVKRMDLILQQINQRPLDEITTNYIVGYFFSRIDLGVLTEIGASCDTPWDTVKLRLRDRYGGAGRTTPRIILREVLIARGEGQSMSEFAKEVMQGVRKVTDRLRDTSSASDERRIRTAMLEELATENLMQNLTGKVKQWVRIVKPNSLEELVKEIINEELEEKDDRSREQRRRYERPSASRRYETEWQAPRRRRRSPWKQSKDAWVSRRPARPPPRTNTKEARGRAPRGKPIRAIQCWECRDEGHMARDCPYMYRREAPRAQRGWQGEPVQKSGWQGEPMEVNMTRARRRVGSLASYSDTASDGDCSETTDQSEPGKRRNGEWPPLKKRQPGNWPPLQNGQPGMEKKSETERAKQ